jgi:hypothetical protein
MLVSTTSLLQSCVQTPTRGGGSGITPTPSYYSHSNNSKGTGKRVALVIGNNRYAHILKLDNPVNDATSFHAKLVKLGFDADLKIDLNKSDMESVIKKFGQKANNANVALLYFSGHGLQIDGENILVPVDYTGSSKAEGISANFVQRVMQDSTKGTKVMMLDACRNDPFADEELAEATTPSKKAGKRKLGKQRGDSGAGLAPITPIDEFFVSYATAAGTTASDGTGKNSPYTAALLQHIEKPIPIEMFFKKVRETVKSTTTPPQVPAEYTSLVGDFCFTDCGIAISESSKVCHLNIGDGIYEGECENGKANGQGVQRYADGEYYSGSFKDNLREGRGTQYLVDATEISGTWKAGRLVSGD